LAGEARRRALRIIRIMYGGRNIEEQLNRTDMHQ
jgi:hypothetical protein